MNNKIKTIISVVIVFAFIAITFLYNNLSERFKPQSNLNDNASIESENKDNETEQKRMAAPEFYAYDKDSVKVKLSDYFGKPIVINFWTSWCVYCKEEMAFFNKVYKELKDEVVFLMVDVVDGVQETEEKGRKYIEENGFTFPVLYDLDLDAANAYGISSFPTTILIDANGDLVAGVRGAIDEETLLKGIDLIKNTEEATVKAEYNKITAKEAKKMLENDPNAILLDVRTEEEFKDEHIEGAILIPDYEIKERAEAELPNKDDLILIYCRSGNRSKTTANLLLSMGYTNVFDFGGINTYPYEKVSNK